MILLYLVSSGIGRVPIGQNCPNDEVIVSKIECENALREFGLRMKKFETNDVDKPAGCYWKSNWNSLEGGFNPIIDASLTDRGDFDDTGGVCKKQDTSNTETIKIAAASIGGLLILISISFAAIFVARQRKVRRQTENTDNENELEDDGYDAAYGDECIEAISPRMRPEESNTIETLTVVDNVYYEDSNKLNN